MIKGFQQEECQLPTCIWIRRNIWLQWTLPEELSCTCFRRGVVDEDLFFSPFIHQNTNDFDVWIYNYFDKANVKRSDTIHLPVHVCEYFYGGIRKPMNFQIPNTFCTFMVYGFIFRGHKYWQEKKYKKKNHISKGASHDGKNWLHQGVDSFLSEQPLLWKDIVILGCKLSYRNFSLCANGYQNIQCTHPHEMSGHMSHAQEKGPSCICESNIQRCLPIRAAQQNLHFRLYG